jgi:hypothetical protein
MRARRGPGAATSVLALLGCAPREQRASVVTPPQHHSWCAWRRACMRNSAGALSRPWCVCVCVCVCACVRVRACCASPSPSLLASVVCAPGRTSVGACVTAAACTVLAGSLSLCCLGVSDARRFGQARDIVLVAHADCLVCVHAAHAMRVCVLPPHSARRSLCLASLLRVLLDAQLSGCCSYNQHQPRCCSRRAAHSFVLTCFAAVRAWRGCVRNQFGAWTGGQGWWWGLESVLAGDARHLAFAGSPLSH